jgi:hypothetical protein
MSKQIHEAVREFIATKITISEPRESLLRGDLDDVKLAEFVFVNSLLAAELLALVEQLADAEVPGDDIANTDNFVTIDAITGLVRRLTADTETVLSPNGDAQ